MTATVSSTSSPSIAYKRALGLDPGGVKEFHTGTGPNEIVYSLADAAIGHANAMAMREDLRVDLQQLDLLCSDIANFRKKHAGVEMQHLRQRSHTINMWAQGFQEYFSRKCESIMRIAKELKTDQDTLARDAKEQYNAAQAEVDELERKVEAMQDSLEEEMESHITKQKNIEQQKDRLERQIRALESKRDTDLKMIEESIYRGERGIKELEIIHDELAEKVIKKEEELNRHEKLCMERYNMLSSENERQRTILLKETAQGMWEQRFLTLVDEFLDNLQAGQEKNPVRTLGRAQMWDEIENLESDIRKIEKRIDGVDNPIATALKHIADCEVGTAKTNMIQLKKLYDQTLKVKTLNAACAATMHHISIRFPELIDKEYLPRLKKAVIDATTKNTHGVDVTVMLSPRAHDEDIRPSARFDTESPVAGRMRRAMATSQPNKPRTFDFKPDDMDYLENPEGRFSKWYPDDFPVEQMLEPIDVNKLTRDDGEWVQFKPRLTVKQPQGATNQEQWAQFGDPWLDA